MDSDNYAVPDGGISTEKTGPVDQRVALAGGFRICNATLEPVLNQQVCDGL